MLETSEKCKSTREKVLPNINDNVSSHSHSSEQIETFQAAQMSMLCLKCNNYIVLKNLQEHRALHEALSLYQFDFRTRPNNEQALCRQRVALIKDLNKLLDISRSAYRKELAKIDLAYEVIKSEMFGRSNIVKSCFIQQHDIVIRSTGARLHKGAALGASESTNEKWRSIMEDSYSYTSEFIDGEESSYFAVFDGYSGSTAAKTCSGKFQQILKKALSSFDFDECDVEADCLLSDAFCYAFEEMDNVLLMGAEETSRNRWSGCSATTCLLAKEILHVANVGNVKAILIKNDYSFQMLTENHTPANKKEKHRIKASGDIHRWSKTMWVNGVVTTTRGLGNHGDPILKSSIINTPAACCVSLADDGQIILVASYGFWQVFDENEVVVLINEWLEKKISELITVENSMESNNDNDNNPSNSVEICVQNEEVLDTECSDKNNEMKDENGLAIKNLKASKNKQTESNVNSGKNQCLHCLSDNTECGCAQLDSELKDDNNESSTTGKLDKRKIVERKSLLDFLRDLVTKYDLHSVAVELSKHLVRAALTGGSKENITVMIVIPYNVVIGSNDDELR